MKSGCGCCLFPTVGSFAGAIIGAVYVGYYLGEVRNVPVPGHSGHFGHDDMLPVGLVLYQMGFLRGFVFGAVCGFLFWLFWFWRYKSNRQA